MERVGGEHTEEHSSIRSVVLASFIGTAIEWYDYFVYGTAAALVFNQLFFPTVSPLAGTLAAFASFAAGFIMRPLGGIVFGHFGDRIGRKRLLILSLLIMGVATAIIGLLPTYGAIGVWAPILLVMLRLIQGFAVGGEWGGAVILAVEHSPDNTRGFHGSWPQAGAPAGLLLSTGAIAIFTSLPEEQFLAWGWRVPFLLSIVLVVIGLFIRLRIAETPAFRRIQEEQAEARMPVLEVIRNYYKSILLGIGFRIGPDIIFYLTATYLLSYATQQLGLPNSTILAGILIAASFEIFANPAYAAISDRVGRRPILIGGALLMVLFAFPFFWLVNTGSLPLIWLTIFIALVIINPSMYGPQAAFIVELFGTRLRYSGASLCYQLASISAGLAPLIATTLFAITDGATWGISGYMIVAALITGVCAYLAKETFKDDIGR